MGTLCMQNGGDCSTPSSPTLPACLSTGLATMTGFAIKPCDLSLLGCWQRGLSILVRNCCSLGEGKKGRPKNQTHFRTAPSSALHLLNIRLCL